MNKLLLELPPLAEVVEIVRRSLFTDTLGGDKIVFEEASTLFSLYLGLYNDYPEIDIYDYLDECDYYEACLPALERAVREPIWVRHRMIPLRQLEVVHASGITLLYPHLVTKAIPHGPTHIATPERHPVVRRLPRKRTGY